MTAYFTPREVVLDLRAPGEVAAAVLGRMGSGFAVEGPPVPGRRAVLRVSFPGASEDAVIEGVEPKRGRVSFFLGNDPRRWRAGLPTYGGVVYRGLYPGIDLYYRAGRGGMLEGEFVVSAGADPGRIRLAYGGAEGVKVTESGGLVIETAAGVVREAVPALYQEVEGGKRQVVAGRFVRLGKRVVGFEVGSYDRSRRLVIDPMLVFSTYLGGNVGETGWAVAVDGSGNVYVAGRTDSTDFPGAGQPQPTYGGGRGDGFVVKLDRAGQEILYSTYLGGSGEDGITAVAIGSDGTVTVTGGTSSPDFQTAKRAAG